MYLEQFDVVDVDPFGSPARFLDSAAHSAKHALFVTATDRAPLSGVHTGAALRKYASSPLRTEYHAEVGLRTLIYAISCALARHKKALVPLCAYSTLHYYRVMVGIVKGKKNAEAMMQKVGHILHCQKCGYRETNVGFCSVGNTGGECPWCGSKLSFCGPLWLGEYRSVEFCNALIEQFSRDMEYAGSANEAVRLISLLAEELNTPTYYDYHLITKRLGISPPKLDIFLSRLRKDGYLASRTHYGGTFVKTDAPIDVVEGCLKMTQD